MGLYHKKEEESSSLGTKGYLIFVEYLQPIPATPHPQAYSCILKDYYSTQLVYFINLWRRLRQKFRRDIKRDIRGLCICGEWAAKGFQ
jgi:hypothetical protein